MSYLPKPRITAYHGTYLENLASILENNFRESKQHYEWFGDGVYFFIAGVGSDHPIDSAYGFIQDQRYSERGEYCKDEICVIEAVIKIDDTKLIDLTIDSGIQLFNDYRTNLLEKFYSINKQPNEKLQDCDVLTDMRNKLGIEFVKGNVYIKFGLQRKWHFQSSVPNVTIFVVNSPFKNIQKPTLKKVK